MVNAKKLLPLLVAVILVAVGCASPTAETQDKILWTEEKAESNTLKKGDKFGFDLVCTMETGDGGMPSCSQCIAIRFIEAPLVYSHNCLWKTIRPLFVAEPCCTNSPDCLGCYQWQVESKANVGYLIKVRRISETEYSVSLEQEKVDWRSTTP